MPLQFYKVSENLLKTPESKTRNKSSEMISQHCMVSNIAIFKVKGYSVKDEVTLTVYELNCYLKCSLRG